jgi:hypothetical protein
MKTISKEIKKTIKSQEKKIIFTENYKNLEEANKKFSELIDQGFILHRGYNIMSIDDNKTYCNQINSSLI